MKHLTIKATVANGTIYTWKFTECKSENDYGNGVYIGVDRGEETYSIDARYIIRYNFEEVCEEEIKAFYGDNLSEYEVIIPPSIKAVRELAKRINEHYPHSFTIVNTVNKELEKLVNELEEQEN